MPKESPRTGAVRIEKRRSTVYVRSGKDVTLYIPSDTPPEVIDYLNQLKMDGYFSQGIIDILTKYVREEHVSAVASADSEIEVFPGKERLYDIDSASPPTETEENNSFVELELDEPPAPAQAAIPKGSRRNLAWHKYFGNPSTIQGS